MPEPDMLATKLWRRQHEAEDALATAKSDLVTRCGQTESR